MHTGSCLTGAVRNLHVSMHNTSVCCVLGMVVFVNMVVNDLLVIILCRCTQQHGLALLPPC